MEEIICWRDKDGIPRCNIEQASTQSSPNGMNWSSEGTGPAIFAKILRKEIIEWLRSKGEKVD
ncbi:MAG: hypothetical protein NHB14_13200 [Desulfosporosinus sp.]|nr:hypothetical protein [Desulfosporosinus sp.]MDA8223482.1 hypothetical protein [Desulfitobacterium hafniense]